MFYESFKALRYMYIFERKYDNFTLQQNHILNFVF